MGFVIKFPQFAEKTAKREDMIHHTFSEEQRNGLHELSNERFQKFAIKFFWLMNAAAGLSYIGLQLLAK